MKISSFNINKFCGPYSNRGQYYNLRNIDFKTSIKKIVESVLQNQEDIIFLQEFTNNKYIDVSELFPDKTYKINNNCGLDIKSSVVAITLKESAWEKIDQVKDTEYANKFIVMELNDKQLRVVGVHNTHEEIKEKINGFFSKKIDVILGDFNDIEWISELEDNNSTNYRDLVTNDMITFKPAQTTVDRIFVRNKDEFKDKIVFNGIVETFSSDHNLLSFYLNI